MTDRMRVDFLRGIAMRAPGMAETADFYEAIWGLKRVPSNDGTVYLRGTGPEPYIYSLTDGADFGIEYIHFGMSSRARLEALYDHLSKAGAPLIDEPTELTTPGGGIGFRLRDPDNRVLRIVADMTDNTDSESHFAMPVKVSHVVVNTPDLKTTEAFYTDMLGFRLSDFYVDRMSFLRCSSDHHSIGLFQNAHASANHVAFEMRDMDSFMRGIGRMKQNGHVPSWGPGRHGPGNNPFAYFVSPSGFVIEFTTELQQIDETTHVAQEWPWGDPELSDRWMTAGPPTPAMRAVMLGRPDRGFPAAGAR
ncbi:glyoxalase [Zhengella mangrovi]|uniref:Glyoxalase n=1 Tax=Zhengella mangrovi TaxID=1982044 RepID=A0A2G1QLM5_9HYPH|nr:VOC family protein [Zhengella mangrovi]PHP66374.1 glyoxalase [Zhengella mangrovi]